MGNALRIIFGTPLVHLPRVIRRRTVKRILGWDIHPDARIGICLLNLKYLRMQKDSSIGHATVVSGLKALELGSNSVIGQRNWISASKVLIDAYGGECGTMKIGNESAITSAHYIDTSGGIKMGECSTIAGVKSTIVTHQIDLFQSKQKVFPLAIGNHSFIGSDCRIVPGSRIGSRIIVAMGSVVTGKLDQSEYIYGGIPAKPLKPLADAEYFAREVGWVGPMAGSQE